MAVAETHLDGLDRCLSERAEQSFGFLERLVAQASVLGEEQGALDVLGGELTRLGFRVELLPIESSIASDPAAGVPQQDYAGRAVVVGRRGPAEMPGEATRRSLLVNGHVDVVPPGDLSAWSTPPFAPTRTDGNWLAGRGAGDMKAGFAMVTLALEALDHTLPGTDQWPLTVVGVIEEECTGNGTLASLRAGMSADAALIPEPTDLAVSLSGVGVLWFDVVTAGRSGHAKDGSGVNAAELLWPVASALRDLARELTASEQPPESRWRETYQLNVGTVRAGDWRSTVPNEARMGTRIGFPSHWTVEEAERSVRAAVDGAAGRDHRLASLPPRVELTGFRAEGYTMDADHALTSLLAQAHARTHGAVPALIGTDGTTDARFYRNQAQIPAVCYGPRARDIHGANEAVDLDSVVEGARTLTRFLPAWFAQGAR